jgi:AraC-like DNA-binding protein
MFSYREYPVAAALSTYIKKFWVLDNSLQAEAMSDKRILPNGCTNLAFIAGEGISIKNQQRDIFLKQGVYLVGQLKSSIQVSIQPYTKITLVQWYPWTPGLLMPFSLQDTADNFIPLGDVHAALYQQLQPVFPGDEGGIIDFFLQSLPRLMEVLGRRDILQPACRMIRTHKGSLGIQTLATELGCSTRFLEKQFKQGLGITPKDYSGIIRVRSLVDAMVALPADDRITQVALAHGFYDQAHFIKTFGAITQTSPGRFQAADFLLQSSGEGF